MARLPKLAKTPYAQENQKLSDNAHVYAVKLIYPLWAQYPVTVRRATQQDDYKRGIDYIASVSYPDFKHGPIEYPIQERFRRRDQWDRYRQVTITEYNPVTRQVSELYKMEAAYILCGGFDGEVVYEWVMVPAAPLIKGIADHTFPWTRGDKPNERTEQPFVCIKLNDLGFTLQDFGKKIKPPSGSMYGRGSDIRGVSNIGYWRPEVKVGSVK